MSVYSLTKSLDSLNSEFQSCGVGNRVFNDGTAISRYICTQICEPIFTGTKGLEEMLHGLSVVVFTQNVEDEGTLRIEQ